MEESVRNIFANEAAKIEKKENQTTFLVMYYEKKIYIANSEDFANDNPIIDCIDSIESYRIYEYNLRKSNYYYHHTYHFIKDSLIKFQEDYKYSGIDYFINNTANKQDDIYFKYILVYQEYPFIELLIKCPCFFEMCSELIRYLHQDDIQIFNECFKPGKNIDEITGLQRQQWTLISQIAKSSFSTYRNYKEWATKENLTGLDLQYVLDLNLYPHRVNKVRKIIIKRFNKKRIFDTGTLLRYLRRVDHYQAINPNDAVIILYDYLDMCFKMKINPVIDSDSLKREHDVCL